MSETGSALGLIGAALVVLALPFLGLVMEAGTGAAMLLHAMAMILLVMSGHIAWTIAGRPFLAFGAIAGLAAAVTRGLVANELAWPIAMLGGLLAGAAAQLVAVWLLHGRGRRVTAAASLLLGQLAIVQLGIVQLGPGPAQAALPDAPAHLTALGLVIAGLVGLRALDRSMLADGLRLARSAPALTQALGMARDHGRSAGLALAGLPAGAAGAVMALLPDGPDGPAATLVLAAPTLSLAVMALAVTAAGGGLATALLLALPMLVLPPMASGMAPILPDLTLAAAAAGVVLTLLLQPGGALSRLSLDLAGSQGLGRGR